MLKSGESGISMVRIILALPIRSNRFPGRCPLLLQPLLLGNFEPKLVFLPDQPDLIVEIGAFVVYFIEDEEEDEEDDDQEGCIPDYEIGAD